MEEEEPGTTQTLLTDQNNATANSIHPISMDAEEDHEDVEAGSKLNGAKVYASDPNIVSVDNSVRARLRRAVSTHRFQVFVVSFVIIDCMVVIAELLMDLRVLGMMDDWNSSSNKVRKTTTQQPPLEAQYLVPDVLHSISIAILSMFLLEMIIKVVAFGLDFLRLGWEIFDAAVIVVTFVLDVLLQHSHSSANGLGLFIILRLWRVARILNGMVRSVKAQAVRHVECEKRRREQLEDELLKCREVIHRQRTTIAQLEEVLKSHGIPLPEPASAATSALLTTSS